MKDFAAGTAVACLWAILGYGLVVGAKPNEIVAPG